MAQTSHPSDSTVPGTTASKDSANPAFSIDINSLPTASSPLNPSSLSDPASAARQKLRPQQLAAAAVQQRSGASARPADGSVGGQHSSTPSQGSLDPSSPPRTALGAAAAPGRRSSSPFGGAASPGRFIRSSASPRHLSPATSQIFERDVQEPVIAPSELSPAIPSHIQTEDHIPAVLEASSLAITDDRLGPDEVEIVQHAAHVPAAVAVPGVNDSQYDTLGASWEGSPPAPSIAPDEGGSTYAAVDPTDPRRLSFISFADIVHADHAEVQRESGAPSVAGVRSASPMRSPLSSFSVRNSPPMSAEVSPTRGGAAPSIASAHGELTIETMRQTLQKTGTNDVTGLASQPLSAASTEDVSKSPLR